MKELEKKDAELKADLKRHYIEIEEIDKTNNVKESDIKNFKSQLKEYENNIPKMEKQNEKLKMKVDKAKAVFDELEAKMQSEIARPKKELLELEEQKGKIQLKIQKEENEIERCRQMNYTNDIDRIKAEMSQTQELVDHEKINMQELEKNYKNICEIPELNDQSARSRIESK